MAGLISARAYHERTKHHVERYARGPETIDWSEPPNPFRSFAAAPRFSLPLSADAWERPFSALRRLEGVPAPFSLASIGALFELTFAISAWKRQGPDQWAMRCLPSSGNLHPTEAYLIARGVASLPDGLYHYDARDHALELRRRDLMSTGSASLYLGLSSVHWREAWKYGERAFRYRALHWEAGMLGQTLYLEAQAMGLAGTGIGCFFDDALHRFLGLSESGLQPSTVSA